jgi:O-antigen/teichoic acid export membrane protein
MPDARHGRTISTRSATSVGVASLVAAVSSYLVIVIAARTLTTAANAGFLAFWSLLFWVFGSIGGIQHETTRAVRAAAALNFDALGVRVVPFAVRIGAAVAAVIASTSPAWGPGLLGDEWVPLTVALCLAVIAFAGHSAMCGALGGSRQWPTYSLLVGAEGGTRLLLVAGAALVGARVVGLEVASALAAGAWLLLVALNPAARRATAARADVAGPQFLRHASQTVVAAIANAALVVGFTVIMKATSSASEFATAAPFILAVAVTRAPLLIPLTAYQGVAITYFLAHIDRGLGALRRSASMIVAAGSVIAVAAWALGPRAMQLLFRSDYWVDGAVLAELVVAAIGLSILMLTGAAVLALGAHREYAAGWVLAALVSIGLLFLPCSLEARATISLTAGPLVGCVVHAAAIVRQSRRRR